MEHVKVAIIKNERSKVKPHPRTAQRHPPVLNQNQFLNFAGIHRQETIFRHIEKEKAENIQYTLSGGDSMVATRHTKTASRLVHYKCETFAQVALCLLH